MTPPHTPDRKKFVYTPPSYEQVVEHLRQRGMPEAIRRARRGNPTELCYLIRSYPWLATDYADAIADLLAIAKYPKRGAPPATDKEDIKQRVIASVRYEEKRDPQVVKARAENGGKLPYGWRKQIVEMVMSRYAEDGELNWLGGPEVADLLGRPEVDDFQIAEATRMHKLACEAFRDEIIHELERGKKRRPAGRHGIEVKP